MKMLKTYSEVMQLETFEERIEYLRLNSIVGVETFAHERYLNQLLYTSKEWKNTRNKIIIRDRGCDLAIEGYDIKTVLYVHHINPLTPEDIENNAECIYDPENLICTSKFTHDFIHYGVGEYVTPIVDRKPNDQVPWK